MKNEPDLSVDPALPPRESMPRHTTPTWEMELLISGATVFALLQLPGVLDDVFYANFARFERALAALVMLPYVYLKSATYAPIVTFVLHLFARGYWVALVGLHSVYPDGVQWQRLRWGPAYLRAIRARTPATEVLIERADNRASAVFGYGIGFALLMLAPLAVVVVVFFIAFALQGMLGPNFDMLWIWHALLGLIFVPFAIATVVDRTLARHWPPESRRVRMLSLLFGVYLRSGVSSFMSYPIVIFMSRSGEKRGGFLLGLGIIGLMGFTSLQVLLHDGEFDPGTYVYLPAPGIGVPHTLDPAHYRDQRAGHRRMTPLPFIPSRQVSGDYLPLFVPYRPTRDSPALERTCPEVAADAADGTAATLQCLTRLYAIALDGEIVRDLSLDVSEDPQTGVRGVLAMIRIAELPAGRHELTIQRTPSTRAGADDAPPAPYRIVFWR